MKRLAVVIVAALGIAIELTAAHAEAPPRKVCQQRGETTVRSGVEGFAAVEAGSDVRRDTPRVFVCYRTSDDLLGDSPFGGVVTVWADPEYGRAGVTCAKHKSWASVDCGHNPVSVPVRAATPIDDPDGPWGISALGIDLGYAVDATTTTVSVDTGRRCVDGTCVDGPSRRATVRRGLRYRALGWECVDGEDACAASRGPVSVTVGEQDAEPTVTDGTLSLDLPAVCVEASTDPIC